MYNGSFIKMGVVDVQESSGEAVEVHLTNFYGRWECQLANMVLTFV